LGKDKEDIIMHNSLNYKVFIQARLDPYGVKEFGFVNKKRIYIFC